MSEKEGDTQVGVNGEALKNDQTLSRPAPGGSRAGCAGWGARRCLQGIGVAVILGGWLLSKRKGGYGKKKDVGRGFGWGS